MSLRSVRRLSPMGFALLLLVLGGAPSQAQSPAYVLFEAGPVRPLALSPSGDRLFATNIPDNRLEVFRVRGNGDLVPRSPVRVGMRPVAVAARSDTEVWVVNHLSDSVSIVDLSGDEPRVARTLLVGDEPRDVVFAGGLAFVTTAHRGQQRTHPSIDSARNAGSDDGDPQLTTEGEPRADVWVFDPTDLDRGGPASPGGVPVEIVELFGDTPRALAVDGDTVYAAVFRSGNRTTTVNEGAVCDGFAGAGPCSGDGETSPGGLPGGDLPGGNPGPSTNVQGIQAPEVGLIVQFDEASGQWQDELGRNWNNGVRFSLPDLDVFEIDATTCGDGDGCDVVRDYSGVGTTLFNMGVNPATGNVYVSNTESQNLTRFEGPGGGGSTVVGDLARTRISVLTPAGDVKPRHLNRHIDYSVSPAPAGTKDHSLSTPLGMEVTSDGGTVYLAAFGSDKVGVFASSDLEDDALWDGSGSEFDPTAASAGYISVSGGGPAGLALNEGADRLYVLTRFDNSIAVVDTAAGAQVGSLPLHSPEPPSVTAGRFMLYDAERTSSNGEASCASCHTFGDKDELAWDLGNPDEEVSQNPIPINLEVAAGNQNGGAATDEFHPMKGPMTTQTLKGLSNSGPMHWRGDRADGFFGLDQSYSSGDGTGDEALSFDNFIVAFPGLVGSEFPPTDPQLQSDMVKFTTFALEMTLPPNPVRALDNSLTPAQQAGRDFYFGEHGGNDCSDGICILGQEGTLGFSCNGCHTLDPSEGFFGTGALASFENETQIMKIPHLRNLYTKVGMFGMPNVDFNLPGDTSFKGDQVRGFGFLHDGSTDTLFRFFTADVFANNATLNAGFDGGDPQRRDVEEFMLAFDSDLAPVVGQQVTLTATNGGAAGSRIDLLIQRAEAAFTSKVLGGSVQECDLVVHGHDGSGIERGWLYEPAADLFLPDAAGDPQLTDAQLRAQAAVAGQELTYTCVPPGSGERVALDRDEDGALDFDEVAALTDPGNAGSIAGACSDGIDNDGDGQVDLADAGCGGDAGRDIENPECSDGVDNDGDGAVDLADANCGGATDDRELKKMGCGLGFELAPLALGLVALRRRRARKA